MVSRHLGALLAALLCLLLCLLAGAVAAQPAPSGLDAALRTALALHPAITGKQAQVDAKGHSGDAARSLRYPSFSAQVQHAGSTSQTAAATPASLRARQPLWAFGRIDGQIAFAAADTEAERADLRRVQRQVLENTALAYANVLGSRERLQLAQQSTAAHLRLHEQIQRRERGQLAARADVSLSATRLAQAQAREQRYAGDLDVALSDLLALTQQPVAAEQALAEHDTALPGADAVLEMALARSTDIGHKQQLVERARAAVEQARTAAMPTVYLQADRWHGQAGAGVENRVSVVMEAALDGMGFAARGQALAATAQLEAAQQDLLSVMNDTRRVTRRLFSQRQTLQTLITTQAASLQDLGTLVDSYRRQYEAGTKSWLDLLNIQREASDQHLQQAQAQSDWRAQSLQLKALIGGFDAIAGSGRN